MLACMNVRVDVYIYIYMNFFGMYPINEKKKYK